MISGEELREFLAEQGVMPLDGLLIADANYSLPDFGWVRDRFASAHGRLIGSLGVPSLYLAESHDCDDFARLAAAHAGLIHRMAGRNRTGLALGEFWYQQRAGSAHAINAAVVRERTKLRLRFLEPQTQREVILNREEVASCSAGRF